MGMRGVASTAGDRWRWLEVDGSGAVSWVLWRRVSYWGSSDVYCG